MRRNDPMARRWFYRRPLFWIALLVMGAIWIAYNGSVPLPAWICLTLLACLVAAAGLPEVGTGLAVAGLFGCWTASWLAPPADPDLRSGTPLTLRGEVVRAFPGSGETTPVLLCSEWRRTRDGWVRRSMLLALNVPGTAAVGDLVEVSGRLRAPPPATNPGGFSARLYWLRHGVRHQLRLRPAGYRRLGHRPGPWWREGTSRLRARILDLNRATLPPWTALLANDFLIGDADPPDPGLAAGVERSFRDSGTIHLLVVSGTQVSLVLFLFLWLAWRLAPLRVFFWLLGVLALGLFYLMTEGDASVQRAAVMGFLFVLGLGLEREPDLENCLGAAALALLAANPFSLFDPGAQLSFAAVWSLARLAPSLRRALAPHDPEDSVSEEPWLRTLHRRGATVLSACVAAHLATAPLLAYHFQRASWSGVLANLIVVPLASVFTYLVLTHGVLSAAGFSILAFPVVWNGAAMLGWVRLFSAPPFGSLDVFPPPGWLLPVLMIGLAVPSLLPRRWVIGWAAALAVVQLLAETAPAPAPPVATLRAVDVGQGDALLLQGPDGSIVLVDSGPPQPGTRAPALVQALRALRVAALDAVVISHAHADHIGELPAVLDAVPVRLLVQNVHLGDWDYWARVEQAAARHRVPSVCPEAGEQLRVRQTTLTFLGPRDSRAGLLTGNPNDESLVLRWDSGSARVLLTGDTGEAGERVLLPWAADLRADVLKVGHHGSRGSTCPEWLEAVRPRCALISCGRDNRFGHPAPAALARLKAAGIPVERTDLGGMITLRISRGVVRVERFVSPRTQ